MSSDTPTDPEPDRAAKIGGDMDVPDEFELRFRALEAAAAARRSSTTEPPATGEPDPQK